MLNALRVGGRVRPALVNKVIGLFMQDVPALMQALRNGLDSADAEQVRRAAHTLKSSAATVAARDLALLAASTEALARDGRLGDVAQRAPQLEALIDQASLQLAAIRDELERTAQTAGTT